MVEEESIEVDLSREDGRGGKREGWFEQGRWWRRKAWRLVGAGKMVEEESVKVGLSREDGGGGKHEGWIEQIRCRSKWDFGNNQIETSLR